MSKYIPMYQCVRCSLPLAAERMVEVLPLANQQVQIRYVCECLRDDERPLAGRYKFVGVNMTQLIGAPLELPWKAPRVPQVVTDTHPDLVLWRWEVEQVESVEEFIDWLNLTAR